MDDFSITHEMLLECDGMTVKQMSKYFDCKIIYIEESLEKYNLFHLVKKTKNKKIDFALIEQHRGKTLQEISMAIGFKAKSIRKRIIEEGRREEFGLKPKRNQSKTYASKGKIDFFDKSNPFIEQKIFLCMNCGKELVRIVAKGARGIRFLCDVCKKKNFLYDE